MTQMEKTGQEDSLTAVSEMMLWVMSLNVRDGVLLEGNLRLC
jgi:hypothetical protein